MDRAHCTGYGIVYMYIQKRRRCSVAYDSSVTPMSSNQKNPVTSNPGDWASRRLGRPGAHPPMVTAASRKRAHWPVWRSISRLRFSKPSLGLEYFCLRARDNGIFTGDVPRVANKSPLETPSHQDTKQRNTCSIRSRDPFITHVWAG